jgi:hypothetical protein
LKATDPTLTCWRQTKFKAVQEDFVNQLGLVVTLGLLVRLLLKSQALVEGVVQLCVCVADLLLADECLETLAETGDIAVVLGERAHDFRVADAVAVLAFVRRSNFTGMKVRIDTHMKVGLMHFSSTEPPVS